MKKTRLFILLSVCLSLLACQVPLLAEPLAAPGEVLYQDDFSDTSRPWPVGDFPGGVSAYVEGEYQVELFVPQIQFLAVSGQKYRDVQVEVEIRQARGGRENLIGLVCRYRDGWNYYFFVISADGYFGLGKVREGQAHLLGQSQMSYSRDLHPQQNHLALLCLASTLIGRINGQTVALAEDSDFPRGDVGLLVGARQEGGVQVYFDNFRVTRP